MTLRSLLLATALLAAPALIAIGTAGMSHADTSIRYNGPSVSAPQHHPAFPHQTHIPQPGTASHHHHQNNHAN